MLKRNEIYQGNALDIIKTYGEPNNFSMCMTSPPYWNLRNYHSEPVIWKGDKPLCKEHDWEEFFEKERSGGLSDKVQLKGEENYQTLHEHSVYKCRLCNAQKCELGLELDSDSYIQHLSEIFEEIKRCMSDWGSLYINLGDTYFNPSKHKYEKTKFANKSYMMIPERFYLKMIEMGWSLRSKIIWHKPNPMPTSATDRFCPDFEYLFFFVKNPDKYYHLEAIEPATYDMMGHKKQKIYYGGKNKHEDYGNPTYSGREYIPYVVGGTQMRKVRTTWTIGISQYKGKHFAVYPERLCEIPIKTSCPDRICSTCGEPVRYNRLKESVATRSGNTKDEENQFGRNPKKFVSVDKGWEEYSCQCNTGFVRGCVIDPFFGRGTTGLVAKKLGFDYIGIDINPDFIEQAKKFINGEIIDDEHTASTITNAMYEL